MNEKLNPDISYFEEVKKILQEGTSVELCVKGKSMRPYLRGNGKETIVITPYNKEELLPGQIVMFPHKGNHVFHRIIRQEEDTLVVQGDGNCGLCEYVAPKDVIGIVKKIIRPNGKTEDPYALKGKVYWRIWYFLRPIRWYLLAIYNRVIS